MIEKQASTLLSIISGNLITLTHTTTGPRSRLSLQNSHANSTETILSLPNRSEPDVSSHPPVHLVTSNRSSPTLHKVEKIFTKGRESLSILTGAAIPSSMKPKQDNHVDFRSHRTEVAESSAYQSSLTGQHLQNVIVKC